MDKLSIALVGIGGYGRNYVKSLIYDENEENYDIVGVVDPFAENSPDIEKIKELKIPVYETLEQFYSESSADLVIISSPIHFHKEQSCLALSKGSHVLCEKPLCATVEDGLEMIKAERESGRQLAIGYQWSYSDAILNLKQDIIDGLFGKPVRLRTLVQWPRGLKYYSRGWAGKKYDSNGRAIFDSVANNATAHYLHNMFFVLGDTICSSDVPREVTAELYRANEIENFDTAAVRCMTKKGTEILFYAAHPVEKLYGPVFCYEFENATISFGETPGGPHGNIVATFKDGTSKVYGNPSEPHEKKLWKVIKAIREGKKVYCDAETALSETICINGIQNSMKDIIEFPDELITMDEHPIQGKRIFVKGLFEELTDCYDKGILPFENGAVWAKAGKRICLD